MLLTKCCCCCSLKYGYLAYGILVMAFRLMVCVGFYHTSSVHIGPHIITNEHQTVTERWLFQSINIYGGWYITATICLFFTLKGIVQKRSILIYPYLVVLVVELTGLIISITFMAIISTVYVVIFLPIAAAILGYEFWSLYSLYKQIKYNEKMRYMDAVPLKAV